MRSRQCERPPDAKRHRRVPLLLRLTRLTSGNWPQYAGNPPFMASCSCRASRSITIDPFGRVAPRRATLPVPSCLWTHAEPSPCHPTRAGRRGSDRCRCFGDLPTPTNGAGGQAVALAADRPAARLAQTAALPPVARPAAARRAWLESPGQATAAPQEATREAAGRQEAAERREAAERDPGEQREAGPPGPPAVAGPLAAEGRRARTKAYDCSTSFRRAAARRFTTRPASTLRTI